MAAGPGSLQPDGLCVAVVVASCRQRPGICCVWGVYMAMSLIWLSVIDGVKLSVYAYTGAGLALLGMAVIALGWKA